MRQRPASNAGITLVEVLVAAALVTVGMLAALSAMIVGFRGVEAAHRSSVALFLAEERLEEVRAVAQESRPALGPSRLAPEAFPEEPYGAIAGRPGYRRSTEVAIDPDDRRNTRRVSVTVFYRVGAGPETFERLSTLVTLP